MGMPVTVDIVDKAHNGAPTQDSLIDIMETIEKIFDYFKYVDDKFSVFKANSEIMQINRGEILRTRWSKDMRTIFELAEQTKQDTNGFFDIKNRKGFIDPSGIVKGWAILNASKIARDAGFRDYCIDAGGDIEIGGLNEKGEAWKIGVRNPFNKKENVKILSLSNVGIATSGTYALGQHIYNPFKMDEKLVEIVSLTIVGPDVYEADRFATAVFAMGRKGIDFIEQLPGLEGYQIDSKGIATFTSGFDKLVTEARPE